MKSDGTVVAVGCNTSGQCNTSDWQDIISVSAGEYHTVGLKLDGTVVAVGGNEHGQCNTMDWRDISVIFAGRCHTVGLKLDGTVVAVGDNGDGQCNTEAWETIVDISAGDSHTVGLKSDGTVIAVGDNKHGQCDITDWRDVVAIVSRGGNEINGVQSKGTYHVKVGKYPFANSDEYKKIVLYTQGVVISQGNSHVVVLNSDGTVVAAGNNKDGQCNVSEWQNIGPSKERLLEKAQQQQRRIEQSKLWKSKGLCESCGGQMSGFLTKKCKSCGK